MTDSDSELGAIALADEYITLCRRRFSGSPPLSERETTRWEELRDRLERRVQTETLPESEKRYREAVRVPCLYSVRCSADGPGLATGSLIEIAEGGVFIVTHEPYKAGSRVVIEMVRGPQSAQLEVEGTVVWSRSDADLSGPAGMGIRFEDLSSDQYEVIADCVRESLLLTLSRFGE